MGTSILACEQTIFRLPVQTEGKMWAYVFYLQLLDVKDGSVAE